MNRKILLLIGILILVGIIAFAEAMQSGVVEEKNKCTTYHAKSYTCLIELALDNSYNLNCYHRQTEDTDIDYSGGEPDLALYNSKENYYNPYVSVIQQEKKWLLTSTGLENKYHRPRWTTHSCLIEHAQTIIDDDKDGYDITEDCDDHNHEINPGKTEICNGIDDNCNSQIDEGCYDTTPPAAITALYVAEKTSSSILWKWINPSDTDFKESVIYINGTEVTKTPDEGYRIENLEPNTEYTITIYTIDFTGNKGAGVSNKAKTLDIGDNLPYIDIKSPRNGKTYYNNEITLIIETENADEVYYRIDDRSKKEYSHEIEIKLSYGKHTIKVYAENKYGEKTKESEFTIKRKSCSSCYDYDEENDYKPKTTSLTSKTPRIDIKVIEDTEKEISGFWILALIIACIILLVVIVLVLLR